MVLSVTFPLLPPSGSDQWVNFVMPTIVLGTHAMPALMRLTRNGMLDVLASDYIRTARSKGLRWHTVLIRHGLRNAMIPLVALTAVQFGVLLGGSRSEEHTSELQSLMRSSYAVFCLKKNNKNKVHKHSVLTRTTIVEPTKHDQRQYIVICL